MCPPTALGAWLNDQEQYFKTDKHDRNIELATFCSLGGPKASEYERSRSIENDGSAGCGLASWVAKLDPKNPQTSRTVVLTTYQSFQGSVLRKEILDPLNNVVSSEKVPEADPDNELSDDEDEDDAPKRKLPEGKRVRYKLDVPVDLFSHRVVDEAQKVKNEDALQSRAIYMFNVASTILITATPYKNHVKDLYGLLRFMFQSIGDQIDDKEQCLRIRQYKQLRNELSTQYDNDFLKIPPEKMQRFAMAVNPYSFKKVLGTDKTTESSVNIAADVVPLISQMIILRRVKGTTMTVCDQTIVVAAEIPRYQIITVELRMSQNEREQYKAIEHMVEHMNNDPIVSVTEQDERVITVGGRVKIRRLRLATFNFMLDLFQSRKVDANADYVHRW